MCTNEDWSRNSIALNFAFLVQSQSHFDQKCGMSGHKVKSLGRDYKRRTCPMKRYRTDDMTWTQNVTHPPHTPTNDLT